VATVGLLGDPKLAPEAMAAIRALITRIVLTPLEEGGLAADLHGDLAQILRICAGADHKHARLGAGILLMFLIVNCRWLRGHATRFIC
jgi:hypothetical protein